MRRAILLVVLALGGCTPSCPRRPATEGPTAVMNTAEALGAAADNASPERLRAALERLLAWHAKHQPALAARLRPGLTREAIDRRVAGLGCRLPEEVYTLYMWRDGSGVVDPMETEDGAFVWYHAFLSLDDALALRKRAMGPLSRWSPRWFPLFHFQEEHYFVVCEDTPVKATPIWHELTEDPDPIRSFTSLTTMIETNAEWHEAGLATEPTEPEDLVRAARRRAELHRARNPHTRFPFAVP